VIFMTAPLKILLVEDKELQGKGFLSQLKEVFPNFIVDWVRDFDASRQALAQHTYVAIVCDQQFPYKPGWVEGPNMGTDLIRDIRGGKFGDENKAAIVVHHSSTMDARLRELGEQLGVDMSSSKLDFENKALPFLKEKLAERSIIVDPAQQAKMTAQPPEQNPQLG